MERIVLEVDDQVAQNWRYSSETKRREAANTVNKVLHVVFGDDKGADFIEFVKEIQEKAAERGLTEDILNNILNDPD